MQVLSYYFGGRKGSIMKNYKYLIRLLGLLFIIVMGCARPTPVPRIEEPEIPEEIVKEAIDEDEIIFGKVPAFMKLSCKSCHKGMKYKYMGIEDKKAGPSLKKIAHKVNASWLFRWIQKPGNYRSVSRMPCFGFSDNDALADTAFTMNQSEKDYQMPLKFTPASDPEKGRLLFEKIGCNGCHEVNHKGGAYAPSLNQIANKVSADWEYNWLVNPKQYDPWTIMPDFRLSKTEARLIVTYLMTLGKREDIEGLEEKIKSSKLIRLGEKITIRKGCYGCHQLNAELSIETIPADDPKKSSVRRLLEKEFGTYKVNKVLKELGQTRSGGSFSSGIEQVSALKPNLSSSNDDNIFNQYKHRSEKTVFLREGLRIIEKYNCRGCHTIDGEGGKLAPVLDYEGARVQTKFLLDFLINPKRIRPTTLFSAKMPTFNFKQDEIIKLVVFFRALAIEPLADESTVEDILPANYLIQHRKVTKDVECEECEVQELLKITQSYSDSLPDFLPVEGENEHVTNGRRLFMYFCAACHGVEGRGKGYNAPYLDPQPRDLTDQKKGYMAKQKNEDLFKVISSGGKSIDKSPRMPPFGNTLSEKEIWEIIAYIRTLHSYEGETIDFENGGFETLRPETVVQEISADGFQNSDKKSVLIGKSLFKKIGCLACHTIGEQGGKVGPDLTYAGSRLRAPWVYQYLKSPQSMIENVQMPNYGLSDDSALKLTYYLLSLKKTDKSASIKKNSDRKKG